MPMWTMIPDPGVEEGWVSTLINGVKIRLAQGLGRSEVYSLWKDHLLSPHTPLTPEIIRIVKNSAILILVLSPGYLAAPWCLKELQAFRDAVETETASQLTGVYRGAGQD